MLMLINCAVFYLLVIPCHNFSLKKCFLISLSFSPPLTHIYTQHTNTHTHTHTRYLTQHSKSITVCSNRRSHCLPELTLVQRAPSLMQLTQRCHMTPYSRQLYHMHHFLVPHRMLSNREHNTTNIYPPIFIMTVKHNYLFINQ